MNIVVFNSAMQVVFRGSYDTYGSSNAANALGSKLNSYPFGTVAAIGMTDSAEAGMTDYVSANAWRTFRSTCRVGPLACLGRGGGSDVVVGKREKERLKSTIETCSHKGSYNT